MTDDEEPIAEGLNRIASALHRLGNADAATPMGGLEMLGKAILDAADKLADAQNAQATALEEIAAALAAISEDTRVLRNLMKGRP